MWNRCFHKFRQKIKTKVRRRKFHKLWTQKIFTGRMMIIALHRQNMFQNCTACRSISTLFHLDSIALDNFPLRHSHNGNYLARPHSNLWKLSVSRLPSRRNFLLLPNPFLTSRNVHFRDLQKRLQADIDDVPIKILKLTHHNLECASLTYRSLPAMKYWLDACHGIDNIVLL